MGGGGGGGGGGGREMGTDRELDTIPDCPIFSTTAEYGELSDFAYDTCRRIGFTSS